jgi:hypothetical protein
MTPHRERILHLSGDAQFASEKFGGFSHVQATNRIRQTELEAHARLKVRRPK